MALSAVLAGCTLARHQETIDLDSEQAVSALPVRFKGADVVGGAIQHSEIDTGQIYHFDLSPDGETLLFDGTMHYKHPNLYMKASHGKGLTLRTDDAEHQYITPRFSKKGDFIAFASDRYGNFDIFIAPANEKTEPIAVTNTPFDEAYPAWHEQYGEDGKPVVRKIAYCVADPMTGDWNIRITDLLKSTTMEVTRGMRPDWSPDGRYLAFQRARNRDERFYSVWVFDLETHHEWEAVSSSEWAAIQPSWSPDGKHIAFTTVYKSPLSKQERRSDKGDDIWITDRDGRYRIQLTSGEEPESWPVWGPDHRVFFLRETGKHRNIWSVRASILDYVNQ